MQDDEERAHRHGENGEYAGQIRPDRCARRSHDDDANRHHASAPGKIAMRDLDFRFCLALAAKVTAEINRQREDDDRERKRAKRRPRHQPREKHENDPENESAGKARHNGAPLRQCRVAQRKHGADRDRDHAADDARGNESRRMFVCENDEGRAAGRRQRGDQRADERTAALDRHRRNYDDARRHDDFQQQFEEEYRRVRHWGHLAAARLRSTNMRKLQATEIASANASAGSDPSRTAVSSSATSARANPPSPITALAMTAAVAGPPTLVCRIIMMLVSTMGNTARPPLMAGPTRKLSVTTMPTSTATMPARRTLSYQRVTTRGIGAWRNGADNQKHNPIATTFHRNASGSAHAISPLAQTRASQIRNAQTILATSERLCASNA